MRQNRMQRSRLHENEPPNPISVRQGSWCHSQQRTCLNSFAVPQRTSDRTPVADAGTSMVVPSVSISTSGSLRLTGSPIRLNHRPIDAFTDAPIFGTRNFRCHESYPQVFKPPDPVSICARHRSLFRRKAFGVDFQSLKKAAATQSQSNVILRRLLASRTWSSESVFVATWASPASNKTSCTISRRTPRRIAEAWV
jgi:hypothetical protein